MAELTKFKKMKKIMKVTKETEPKRNIFLNMIKAFFVGGLICLFGEIIRKIFLEFVSKDDATSITLVVVIFIASFLTAIGVYDKIGQFAGCGTIIPITGFANSMTSSSMETKTEGLVVGVLNNVFKLAGSVIATAILTGFFFGLIRFLGGLIFE